MFNRSLSAATAEVYATAPDGRVPLETLTISHPQWPEVIRLVKDRIDHELTLETGETHTFKSGGFTVRLPKVADGGIQNLPVSFVNTDDRISEYLDLAEAHPEESIVVEFRLYLSNDKTAPQAQPHILTLSEVEQTAIEVRGVATFVDLVNKPYLTEYYDDDRFPGLR